MCEQRPVNTTFTYLLKMCRILVADIKKNVLDWGQCLGVSFLYWRSQRSAVSLKYNPSLILGPRRGQVFCHSLLFSSKTRSLSEPSATLLFLRGQTKAQKHLVTSSNVGQSLALSPGPLRWLLLGGSFRPPPPTTTASFLCPLQDRAGLACTLAPGFEVPEDVWDQVCFQGPEDSSAIPLLPRHPKDALVGGQE